jgi:HAD superfamily hydrolase (TIGR01662 family)
MMQMYGRLLSYDEIDELDHVDSRPMQAIQYTNRALILDFDDTLRHSVGKNRWPEKPEDVRILPNRTEVLKKYADDGWLLLGASNQSAISKGLSTEDCIKCFEETVKLLNIEIQYKYCPHRSSPVSCCCRKPLPGIGAYWTYIHRLDPSQCIMVGDAKSDKEFAENCGFQYQTPEQFFSKC